MPYRSPLHDEGGCAAGSGGGAAIIEVAVSYKP
jgi:hypothetical protein